MRGLDRILTVDALVIELRGRVLSGDFAPGDKLREIELAKRYGVGRYSLRGALRVLTDEGLLRHEPHRGVYVPVFARSDVEDLFVLRRALEVEGARRVVQTGASLAESARAVARLETLTGDEPWHQVTELDLGFHTATIKAAGSARLQRIFTAHTSELRLVLAQSKSDYEDVGVVGREHRALFLALQSGDASVAEAAVREHLEEGARSLLLHFP